MDEIEAAEFIPKLVHARKAKLMMGMINKTDKLDARGLNQLQRTGTPPTVWIPPGDLRDQRDLPRTRMVLVRQRTQLKNRIHATLAKYALTVAEVSDLFGRQGRELLEHRLDELPPQTAFATGRLLEQVEALDCQVRLFEQRMQEIFEPIQEIELLMTLPGVGFILLVDKNKVLQLRPVNFKWKGRNERGVGLIAEDVEPLIPELVTYYNGRIEGVRYGELSVYLLDILKEHEQTIRQLKADNDALKARIEAVEGKGK